MTEVSQLDIVVRRRKAGEYTLQLSSANSASGSIAWNLRELDDLAEDPVRYGQAFSQMLFAEPGVGKFFSQAYDTAKKLGNRFRVARAARHCGARVAGALLGDVGKPLERCCHRHGIRGALFSLCSQRHRPPALQGALASTGSGSWPALPGSPPGGWLPPPADLAGELALARACLGDIPVTELAAPVALNMDALAVGLRQGADILYLACQALLADGEPWLWLEDTQGTPILVPGSELVARVRDLDRPPRLVVLAPFQNASRAEGKCSSDVGALSVLAPALVDAGIPRLSRCRPMSLGRPCRRFYPRCSESLLARGRPTRPPHTAALRCGIMRTGGFRAFCGPPERSHLV